MGAPSYIVPPAKLAPDFGILGPLCLWSEKVTVEDNIPLRLLPTSIQDIYKVFEPLVCCLTGIWMHPYTGKGYSVLLAVCSAICPASFGRILPFCMSRIFWRMNGLMNGITFGHIKRSFHMLVLS